GDGIGGAGAGGHQHTANLAGRAGIAFGRVHGALLVADQDVAELVLLEQLIIDRQHRSARIAEKVLDALVGQGLDHHLGAGHFPCHVETPAVSRSLVGITKKAREGLLLRATERPAYGRRLGGATHTIRKLRSMTVTRTKIAGNIATAVQKSSAAYCGAKI